jgi:hypothetical protein
VKRYLPAMGVVLAAGLTLASGLIHGRMNNRWGMSEDLQVLGERLQGIPDEFGAWRLRSSEELTDTVTATLQCAGYVARTYANQQTGQIVTVTVLVGAPVPLSLHPPEVCYEGAGYQAVEGRKRIEVPDKGGSDQQFWTVTLQADDAAKTTLEVAYAWSAGGSWSRLEESRLKVASYPYLYKIQVATQKAETGHSLPGPVSEEGNACREFIQDFLPVAKRYLMKPSSDRS